MDHNNVVSIILHLPFYETQQMFLIHARSCMNVSVHLKKDDDVCMKTKCPVPLEINLVSCQAVFLQCSLDAEFSRKTVTQVHKWVSAKLMLEVTLSRTSILFSPFMGGGGTPAGPMPHSVIVEEGGVPLMSWKPGIQAGVIGTRLKPRLKLPNHLLSLPPSRSSLLPPFASLCTLPPFQPRT